MDFCMVCARRLAIAAALTGALVAAMAGADICATGIVAGGMRCAHFGASALTMLGY